MTDRPQLNDAWIREGLHKLEAKYSNVICFETEDRERFQQLLNFLSADPQLNQPEIYLYDPWQGLCRLERNQGQRRLIEVTPGENDRFCTNIPPETKSVREGGSPLRGDLSAALRYMDDILQKKKVFLILKNLETVSEKNYHPILMEALRSWSNEPKFSYRLSAVFLLASNAGAVLDPFTLQQCALIKVDLSSESERAFIITDMYDYLSKIENDFSQENEAPTKTETLTRLTAGLNLHQLRTILLESHYRKKPFDPAEIGRLKGELIKREDIVEILEPQGGFASVGGYEPVKEFIRQNIIKLLKDPTTYEKFGAPLPRGLLLFGPPGTGKTLFAKALAGETNMPFINFKTENMYGMWLGESGKNFAKAINIAEKHAPAIVFIDEIDKFGKRRGETTDGASEETRRVYNQILEWLGAKDRQTIVVGTTNRPEDLDRALIRSGRLDYQIPFLYPDIAARGEILKIHFGMTGIKTPLPVKNPSDLENWVALLAQKTEHYSGAELEELTNRIRRHAPNRGAEFVEEEDINEAFKKFTINRDERYQEVKRYYETAQQFTNDIDFFSGFET